MKLYEHYGKSGFHTCIVSTFGVDFDAYENVIFSRARGAGCHNNLLITDSRMLSLALGGNSSLPRHAGRLYSVTGATAAGVFHPKVTLQLGRSAGRLIVSSANVTSAGLAGNLELGGVVECQADDSGERKLVTSAFRFLARFLDASDPGVGRQLDWMHARTPWLLENEASLTPVLLKDGSRAAFLTSGNAQGIARQFLDFIGDEKVERLIVLSPYWDNDLATLHFLIDQTAAAETFVLLDQHRHLFPPNALDALRPVKLIDFKADDEKRFIHSKLIIVQTAKFDHVLYGSANSTVAAVGNETFPGLNEEACLYRALPREAAIERLRLSLALQSPPLDQSALPALMADEPIPLADLAAKFPGRFSCLFDTLTWRLPQGVDPETDRLELLGSEGQVLPLSPQAVSSERSDEKRYHLSTADERPHFARVRFGDGRQSAPGVILVLDILRAAVRDARTKQIDLALAALDGEMEIGLWLLETVSKLEAAETAFRQGVPIKRQKEVRLPDNADDALSHAKLSYEDFVAGRRLRSDTLLLSRDSLGGTNFSYVRGFLNRILGLDGRLPDSGAELNPAGLAAAFDLGDEVADGEEALEQGAEFRSAPPDAQHNREEAELIALTLQRLAQQRRSNRDQLVEAVANFQKQIAQKASGPVTSIDLLRLRAMLMIILAAGWDGLNKPSNSLQVLPPSNDMEGAWPRLLGKCLFSYFGGTSPPVRKLVIEDDYDQIPDDILECWASCLWTLQAIMDAVLRTGESRVLIAAFQKLGTNIYALTCLRRDEFFDGRIAKTFDALNEKFAKPLNLSPERLLVGHQAAITSLENNARAWRVG